MFKEVEALGSLNTKPGQAYTFPSSSWFHNNAFETKSSRRENFEKLLNILLDKKDKDTQEVLNRFLNTEQYRRRKETDGMTPKKIPKTNDGAPGSAIHTPSTRSGDGDGDGDPSSSSPPSSAKKHKKKKNKTEKVVESRSSAAAVGSALISLIRFVLVLALLAFAAFACLPTADQVVRETFPEQYSAHLLHSGAYKEMLSKRGEFEGVIFSQALEKANAARADLTDSVKEHFSGFLKHFGVEATCQKKEEGGAPSIMTGWFT